MGRLALSLLLPSWLVAGGTAGAQPVTGSIEGMVSTPTGMGLVGVTVTARNRATGLEQATTTNSDGDYVLSALPADGSYDVIAELAGFAPIVRRNIALDPTGSVHVPLVMRAEVEETVAVTAPVPPLQRERSTVQQRVSERLVHTLPLIGRDFLSLASLTAGFTGNPNYPSPQGQVFWSNNVLVDGASHFSKWRSAARTFYSGYSLESIKEVQVLTSQFSAEFGEALATVTSAVTNSGTNELRGTGLLFVQDDVLNDTPAFTHVKPPSSSQRFGATLGGPVVMDRTHFFVTYEGWRSRGRNIVVSPAAPEAVVPDNEDQHLVFGRIDHRSSSRQLWTVHYNGQWFDWHNETGGLALPGTGTQYTNNVHTMLFSDAIVISNRLISNIRVQFARYVDVREDLDPRVYVSRQGYSVQGGAIGPFGFGADPEDTWEAANALSYTAGPHALRFGGGVKHVGAHNTALPFGRGAYYFAGPPALYPQPFLFTQGLATSEAAATADPRSLAAFGFLQDDWRVGSRFTLNAGLRYDVERVANVTGFDVAADTNNFQPRVGLAWDPTGNGHTTIRGGAGIYTQQQLLYYINRVQLEGEGGANTVSLAPGSPLMPTFPNTLPASLPVTPPRDIQVVENGFRNPYSVQATAGGQHMLFGTLVGADYIYLNGRDLMSLVDLNAPASIEKPAQRTVDQADLTRPLRPVPNGYRKIVALGNRGKSWYHALQIKAERSSGRLQAMASYTLARADDEANYLLPEDSRRIEREKGRADSDIRHNMSAALTWELPGTGRLRGGWTVAGLGLFRSSRPYTITWGDDRNGTTQNDARPGDRNTAEAGAFRSVDLSATKRLRAAQRTVELKAEAFNVFSATNFDQYVGALSSPAYNTPVSAFPRRRFQLAVITRF
jgi:outer membrane receptor protein involved in Fe transport